MMEPSIDSWNQAMKLLESLWPHRSAADWLDEDHENCRKIALALDAAHKRGLLEGAEIAESGYLYGTDGKNDDFACSKCGGDIRAACCIWAYNYNTNKEIAEAIRHRAGEGT